MSEQKLSDWIQDHLDRYIATDGEDGHMWNGLPTLLLTTKGRQSGENRQLPLIYGENEGAYIVVASKGGHSHHPSWYLNLDANPEVELQVKAERFKANARTAEGEERAKLWEIMSSIFPTYIEYQERADTREIPVVVCERA
ncbi:MAG: nitroreductase family deazaflavin-dependent oxidoreductase [Gammaproteobacteria bacterium]|nr:nitroreductase family deazaflavin-dependent oxidoreductase [Gammaproteobacteria bacterium]